MVQARQVLMQNSVGRKIVMAVTGAIMVFYVLAHMTGNLLVFAGPEDLNAYGEFIQEGTHGLVWLLRIGMLGVLVAHVWAMVGVVRSQQTARSSRYQFSRKNQRTNYAALTMRFGGPVILLYLIYHLAHLTVGNAHPNFIRGDVYHNLTVGLSDPVVAGVYIAAQVALLLHLFHGIRSGLKTVGLPSRWDFWGDALAAVISVVVFAGNMSIVLAIQLGFL